jgi:ferric-dicitrate binding protein FerR (iron transport regulator)
MTDEDVPWLLLERYYAGRCTSEEQATLDSWIGGDPRRRRLVERLRTVFSDTPPTPSQSDIEQAWIRFANTIEPSPRRSFPIGALLAAGVLALLGVAWFAARHATR